MAHETPTIIAEKRERTGTRYAKRLRQSGRLPGIIYGHKQDPVAISVNEKEALSILKHGTHIVNVTVAGADAETCLVKELQFGFLGDNVVHIDLARVDLEEEVSVKVHLKFHGEPAAAKKPGAVLTTNLTELEVICKAGEIPAEIKVQIGDLEELITVSEITLPAGVRTEVHPDTPVVSITFVAEEVVGEQVEVAAVAVEPEVITEKKEPAAPAEE